MNLCNRHNPGLPGTLIFQPAGDLTLPDSVETADQWSIAGSGIGTGTPSVVTALGEYFERRHFYREITPDLHATLGHSLTTDEICRLVYALEQTSERTLTAAQIKKHSFNLSKVYRTSDFTHCHIPTVLLSLSYHLLEGDTVFYPRRDTCGCSFHWRAEHGISGAIREQLERQFLARLWLTKTCNRVIRREEINNVLSNSRTGTLYHTLANRGELATIDISDSNFPGLCLLMVYGQKNPKHHVQYCAGLAYTEDLGSALEKSLEELWQTFRFIDRFKSTHGKECDIKDTYLTHFLKCNSYSTFREITSVSPINHSPAVLIRPTLNALLSSLQSQQIQGYLYLKPANINNNHYYFCKYISPDLFLHMDNSNNINTRNRYSEQFLCDIHPDRQATMVPFP